MNNNQEDLFEHYNMLPRIIQNIISKFSDISNYTACEQLIKDLHIHGYSCDYGLDAVPFNLRQLPS